LDFDDNLPPLFDCLLFGVVLLFEHDFEELLIVEEHNVREFVFDDMVEEMI
jgi:hypothetical protein